MINDIFIVWLFGFTFVSGVEYHKTVRGDYIRNAKLALKLFFIWPVIFWKS